MTFNLPKAALIASPRVMMSLLFLSAAIKFYPEHNTKWMVGNIDKSAWLFGAASICYTIATVMDGIPHFLSANLVGMAIFFVYLVAGFCVLFGSIWFLQGVQDTHPNFECGQHLYVSAAVLMMFAVLCDLFLLLTQGKKISVANAIAVLAIVPGAACFLVATVYTYTDFLFPVSPVDGVPFPSQTAFEKSSACFVAASMFFIAHAFAYLITVNEILNAADAAVGGAETTTNKEVEMEMEKETPAVVATATADDETPTGAAGANADEEAPADTEA
jgi:hypothetical protein